MRGLADDSSELPTREKPVARIDDDDASGPMVTVDWMAASAEGSAVSDAVAEAAKTTPARPKEKDRKAKEKEKADDRAKKKTPARPADTGTDELSARKPTKPAPAPRAVADDSGDHVVRKRESRSLIVGALLGGVLAAGASAAVYFSGVIPNADKTAQVPVKPNEGKAVDGTGATNLTPSAASAPKDAFAAGDTAGALKALKDKPAVTTADKAGAGFVRVFAKVQALGKANAATAAADDPDLEAARADLKAVIDDADAAKTAEGEKRAVAASVRLGVSFEVAGNPAEARKVFADGKVQFPKYAAVFDAHLDRLDADKGGAGTSFRAPASPPKRPSASCSP